VTKTIDRDKQPEIMCFSNLLQACTSQTFWLRSKID